MTAQAGCGNLPPRISQDNLTTACLVPALAIIEWRAVSPPGHQAIFHLAVGIEFMRQKPSDSEQQHHNAKRDHGAPLIPVLLVTF